MMKSIIVSYAVSLIAATAFAAVLSSCSKDSPAAAPLPEARGTRSYKLDPEAVALKVSLFGVTLGTPDEAKFHFLLESLKAAGEFSELHNEATGIEGGFTMCAVFSSSANKKAIYELLRTIETDSRETNLTASSLDRCGD